MMLFADYMKHIIMMAQHGSGGQYGSGAGAIGCMSRYRHLASSLIGILLDIITISIVTSLSQRMHGRMCKERSFKFGMEHPPWVEPNRFFSGTATCTPTPTRL